MALIGVLGFSFVGMTMINLVLGGQFMSSSDVGIMNQMTFTQRVDVGLFSVPIPNLSFWNGISHLVKWDYSFFGGNAELITFFFYSLTFVVAFMLFTLVVGLLYNAFSRVR